MLTVNKGKQKSAWSSRQDEREFSLFVVVSETMNQTTTGRPDHKMEDRTRKLDEVS